MLNDFLSGSAAWGVLLTLAAFALGALINRITGKVIYIYKHFYSSNQIYYENDFSIHGCLYSLTYVQLLR